MKFSISEENYIKSIYHLQSHTGMVNTNSLAKELNTRPASITDMLKKLNAKKLLNYEKYHGFKLNDAGNKLALHIIRRHRLWEYFLVKKLDFAWDKVHAIAEELEHVGSIELIEKLDAYLDTPTVDPHGDPIPDIHGKLPSIKQINLYGIALKKSVTVSSVSNQSPQMLDMLKHYNIGIGTKLTVTKVFDFDGSIQVKISKMPDCVISEQVAKNIFVYHD
ncbi:MAG: metal-dependent transcriptional regulator [Ginsengibacter sp.]